MNWPSVIVFVKYALPRVMLETIFTNSTSARSRASMKVLIMMPGAAAVGDFASASPASTYASSPIEFL